MTREEKIFIFKRNKFKTILGIRVIVEILKHQKRNVMKSLYKNKEDEGTKAKVNEIVRLMRNLNFWWLFNTNIWN